MKIEVSEEVEVAVREGLWGGVKITKDKNQWVDKSKCLCKGLRKEKIECPDVAQERANS